MLEQGGLRLIFEWRGDRYAHRVSVAEGTGERVLLESLEASDAAAWPASPPLQQVHIESRGPEVAVALAVGMAGRSHWSAACELDGRQRRVTFDIACRIAQPAERLASGYRFGLPATQSEQGRVILGPWELVVEDDTRLVLSEAEADRIEIVPRAAPLAPATARWPTCAIRPISWPTKFVPAFGWLAPTARTTGR